MQRPGLIGRRDDVDEADLVGIRMSADRAHLSSDDAFEPPADVLHTFNFKAESVEQRRQLLGGRGYGDHLAQPGQNKFHKYT